MKNKWLIYKVLSPSGKVYIGKTTKLLGKRQKEHEHEATLERYEDNAFKRAICKYGDKLEWSIVENNIDTLEKSNEREIHWIRELNSANSNRGYNSTFGGEGAKLTQETKDKISKALKGNKAWNKGISTNEEAILKRLITMDIKQFKVYDKNGNLVGQWSSQKICANELGLRQGHISLCLSGKLKSHGGYTFKKTDISVKPRNGDEKLQRKNR